MRANSDSKQNNQDKTRSLLFGIVQHPKYGDGVVVEISGDRVEIRFSVNEPPKKFKFPMVFESIVSFKDPKLDMLAKDICASEKAAAQKELLRKIEEQKALMIMNINHH